MTTWSRVAGRLSVADRQPLAIEKSGFEDVMGSIDLAPIISGAFDAALREDLWEAWSEDLFSALGGSGGLFGLHDADNIELTRIISMAAPARSIDEYKAGYYQFDPQIPYVASLSGRSIYISSSDVEVEDKNIADYLKWQDSIACMSYFQTAVMPIAQSSFRVSICFHKTRQLGPVTPDQNRALRRIAPQLEHVFELAFRHNELIQQAFWDGILIGRSNQIAFLLDERGKVIRHTDAAQSLIARRDGIDIVRGNLSSFIPAEAVVLQDTIARAIRLVAPVAGSMRISRRSGKLPLIAVCYPLQRSSRMMAPLEAAALMTMVDPHATGRSPLEHYRAAFGLTVREAEFAAAMLAGHSVESAAALLAISQPTARSHLQQLFRKTGVDRQAALIRLLTIVGRDIS